MPLIDKTYIETKIGAKAVIKLSTGDKNAPDGADSAVITAAIAAAEAEMFLYLNERYETPLVFETPDSEAEILMKDICAGIAIYKMTPMFYDNKKAMEVITGMYRDATSQLGKIKSSSTPLAGLTAKTQAVDFGFIVNETETEDLFGEDIWTNE